MVEAKPKAPPASDFNSLPKNLKALYDKADMSDVTFHVGPNKVAIRAHRLVLAFASPIFKAMLYKPNLEGEPLKTFIKNMEVSLPDEDPNMFKQLLQAVYLEDYDSVSTDKVKEMLRTAHKYGCTVVKGMCLAILDESMQCDDAIESFVNLAASLGLPELGWGYIRNNYSVVLKSQKFLEIPKERLAVLLSDDELACPEVTIFDGLMRWGRAACRKAKLDDTNQNVKEQIKDLLPHIRFPLMTFEQLKTVVASAEVLGAEEMVELYSYVHVEDEDTFDYTLPYPRHPRSGSWSCAFEAQPIVAVVKTFGQTGSVSAWDDAPAVRKFDRPFSIKEIRVWSGTYVRGIQVVYRVGTKAVEMPKHCGTGTDNLTVMSFAEDEYITAIHARTGDWLDTVTFVTNKKTMRFGTSNGGSPFSHKCLSGQAISALAGGTYTSNQYQRYITFYTSKIC